MKNLRFLITVLALVNAGLVAQVAAAPSTNSGSSASTGQPNPSANKVFIGVE